MRKYDLAKMLEEIRRDDLRLAPKPDKKKVLTQDEIRALARSRRQAKAVKPPEP